MTQTTAWKIKHKLAQVMMEREAGKRLKGRIELMTPIMAAVETTPQGKPIRLKLRRVAGFSSAEIAKMAKTVSTRQQRGQ
ncbi:hypothetical protein GCM10023157_05340 [Gluconacetobacter asukensis]